PRTCPHAPGCIDTPSFMTLDGLGAADVHRLSLLPRVDGDVAAHVAVTVARTDHGVVAGLELDVAPGEGAERADAGYRHLRAGVGNEGRMYRLIELRQQRRKTLNRRAHRRTRRRLLLRRLQPRDRLDANLGRRQPLGAIDQSLQRIPELQARGGPGLAFLRKDERAILTQRRGVELQRLVPTFLRLETLAARAQRGEAALAGGSIYPPQALQGLDPVGTQALRPCESRARLIEAAGAQRRETLAGRPGVTVIAQGGARPGEPHAGLRILRVECEHLGVVLRRARVLSRGLRILGVREQRQNARQTSGSAPPQTPAPRVSSTARRRSNCVRSIANLALASGFAAGAALLPGAGTLSRAPLNGAGAAAEGSLA